jgi:hypothetical protein
VASSEIPEIQPQLVRQSFVVENSVEEVEEVALVGAVEED